MTTTRPHIQAAENIPWNKTMFGSMQEVLLVDTRYMKLGTPSSSMPPIVFLHGTPGGLEVWAPCLLAPDSSVSRLSEVVALDLVGHGGAFAGPNTWPREFDRVADFVASFLKEIGITDVVLVGHSYGGIVAQILTARESVDVRGLVLINSFCFPRDREKEVLHSEEAMISDAGGLGMGWSNIPILGLLPHALATPESVRNGVLEVYSNDKLAIDAHADKLYYVYTRHGFNFDTALWLTRSEVLETGPEAAGRLDTIGKRGIPVLLIWGADDRSSRVESQALPIAKGIGPNCTWAVLADVGHCPHQEAPERVNQLLNWWLGPADGILGGDLKWLDDRSDPRIKERRGGAR